MKFPFKKYLKCPCGEERACSDIPYEWRGGSFYIACDACGYEGKAEVTERTALVKRGAA